MSPLPLLISPRGQAMLSHLPSLYERSRVMQSLLQSEGLEFDSLRQALDEMLLNCYAATATWGLDRWEFDVGLPVAPALSDVERRERITARLRGYGTCTIQVAKTVASAYTFGDVEVVEDIPAYTITVTFVSEHGVPPQMPDLEKALRAVVPAHLAINYVYTWLTWDTWDSCNSGQPVTWDQLDGETLAWDQFEVLAPDQHLIS